MDRQSRHRCVLLVSNTDTSGLDRFEALLNETYQLYSTGERGRHRSANVFLSPGVMLTSIIHHTRRALGKEEVVDETYKKLMAYPYMQNVRNQ